MVPTDSPADEMTTETVQTPASLLERIVRSRRRRVVLIVVIGFVLALVVAGLVAGESSQSGSTLTIRSSGVARQFRLPSLRDTSTEISLSDFRGRPVVINFWASWCVPCRKEMPALQAAYRKMKGRIAFVGIDHQDTRDDGLTFVRQTGVHYPIAFDSDGTTARAYGLFGVPTTVFIDAKGREVERYLGQISETRLAQTIDRLFPPKSSR